MSDQEFYKYLDKLETYCAYQERTCYDVMKRMERLKIPSTLQAKIVDQLKEHGFLNEERYVRSFINSKIQIKRDGLQKIKFALRRKQINSRLIDEILKEFHHEQYTDNIHSLLTKKWILLKEKNEARIAKEKLIRYMLGKGYQYADFKDQIAKL